MSYPLVKCTQVLLGAIAATSTRLIHCMDGCDSRPVACVTFISLKPRDLDRQLSDRRFAIAPRIHQFNRR